MAPNPYLKALGGGQKGGSESASPATKSKTKKTKKDSTSTAKGQSKPQNDDSGLRKEILALGGDEEDYKLLQGVESESELEESEAEEQEQSKGSKPAVSTLRLSTIHTRAQQADWSTYLRAEGTSHRPSFIRKRSRFQGSWSQSS